MMSPPVAQSDKTERSRVGLVSISLSIVADVMSGRFEYRMCDGSLGSW